MREINNALHYSGTPGIMENELQATNNYIPFDIHGSSVKICDDSADVEFKIKSFKITPNSVIDVSQSHQFSLDITFNRRR